MNDEKLLSLHLTRFLLAMLATFAISAVLFTASFFVLPIDMGPWQLEHGRPEGDPLRTWGLIGHALQSVTLTLIYFLLVRSKRVAAGIAYGLLMTVYLTATDLTVLAAFEAASPTFTFAMIPVNLVVGIVSGWALSLLYRPAKSDKSEASVPQHAA